MKATDCYTCGHPPVSHGRTHPPCDWTDCACPGYSRPICGICGRDYLGDYNVHTGSAAHRKALGR